MQGCVGFCCITVSLWKTLFLKPFKLHLPEHHTSLIGMTTQGSPGLDLVCLPHLLSHCQISSFTFSRNASTNDGQLMEEWMNFYPYPSLVYSLQDGANHTYIWNPERWYRWTYSQDSNGDADIGSRLMDRGWGEEREGERNGERSMEAYTLSYVKEIAKGNFLYDSGISNQGSVTTRGVRNVGGGRKVREGGDPSTPMANSHWCMAEIRPIL